MKDYKAEIIAVGTELLLGQIDNTNASWLSQRLAAQGISVYQHVVVGDNLDRVYNTFKQAQKRSDIIIVTGGLGPTEDDLTREAFQHMSKLVIEEHEPSMRKIKDFYNRQNMKMTPNNRKQARVFKGSHVLHNKVGMAPGMIVMFDGRIWIFLPGVPREMKQLAVDEVFPFIQQKTGNESIIKSLVLKFIGIGESSLEHQLSDLIQGQTNPTIAPLAQDEGVVIRLTAKASTSENADDLLEDMKQEILTRTGNHFYGINDDKIEEKVVQLLRDNHQYIAAAESLTGGMFANKLISVSGASQVCRGGIVCYDTKVKEEVVGVSPETIKQYGTVSEECALEMAQNVLDNLNATIGISFTGVAGPLETEGKPVGTVYIGICTKDNYNQVKKFEFNGDRETVRKCSVLKGMELILNYLKFKDS